MTRVGRPLIDPLFILPVTATYSSRDKASNTYSNNTNKCTELSIQDETQIEETINVDSFTTHEQSVLNKIDPDINYLNAQTIINNTKYSTEHSFRKKIGKTTKLSLFHLNIRSIPDHFLEFTSFLDVLDVELKVIAISETLKLIILTITFQIIIWNKMTELKKEEGVYVYICTTHSSIK